MWLHIVLFDISRLLTEIGFRLLSVRVDLYVLESSSLHYKSIFFLCNLPCFSQISFTPLSRSSSVWRNDDR